MANVKHEGRYDAERNIVFTKFINTPKTFEDVDVLINGNAQWYRSGGSNKVWLIADISKMGMAAVKIVQDYHKKEKDLLGKYVIDFCTVCSKPLERVAAQLFNVFMREKHPTCKTMDEAIEWILKQQEIKGVTVPL